MDEYSYKLFSRIFSDGLHYSGLMIGVYSIVSEMDNFNKLGIVGLGGTVYLIGSLVQNDNEIVNNAILTEKLRRKDSKLEKTASGEPIQLRMTEQPD